MPGDRNGEDQDRSHRHHVDRLCDHEALDLVAGQRTEAEHGDWRGEAGGQLTARPRCGADEAGPDPQLTVGIAEGSAAVSGTTRRGQSGLTGGAVPTHGGIALDLMRMNRIIEINRAIALVRRDAPYNNNTLTTNRLPLIIRRGAYRTHGFF